MGSSDFSQTSLSFNLVVNPYELSYWGISPSVEFACIIILVILCLLAIWSIVHLISSVSVFRTAPISIGHLLISLCSVWVGIAPISIDHFIVMLVWVRVTPISISHLSISLCSVWVETTHIWIGHLYCQFEFLGSHLYRSTIFLSIWVFRDRTYIDWSFILSVWVWVFRAAPISIDHLPISLCSVWVGTAPISIGHCLIS